MKRIGMLTILALLAATVVPAAFASHIPTTGTQLSMYLALNGSCAYPNVDRNIHPKPVDWPANSAFFVRHGWFFGDWNSFSGEEKAAITSDNTRFDLYVDGTEQSSILDFDISPDGNAIKLFVINYPDGMTDTHIFRGEWWIDGLLIEEDPGEAYLDLVCVLKVTFF